MEVTKEQLKEEVLAKFLKKVSKLRDCWGWIGNCDSRGYGKFCYKGKSRGMLAHRASYLLFKGPIAEGMTVDHLCNNPNCVNPDHLKEATHWENNSRGNSVAAINARKTHCPKGHPYDLENTFLRKGNNQRVCRACDKSRIDRMRREYRASRRLTLAGKNIL